MRQERSWLRLNETHSSCPLDVQIGKDGRVTLIHQTTTDTSLVQDSGNRFRVRWAAGGYPTVASGAGCGAGCSPVGATGDTCRCNTRVQTAPVFTSMSSLPDVDAVNELLAIGSAPPDAFAAGVYELCTSVACNATRAAGVTIYLHNESSGLDERTIFHVVRNGTRHAYLSNKVSTVHVGYDESTAPRFSFRNPPTFHSFLRPAGRDAHHETEALIDHLFYHPNVGPFIATRMIQRFTTSNPSPRYVRAVADAFKSGAYGGRAYSGSYGDLGALFAAILLDREARSTTLDADPTHGQLREPLLKAIHLLRSLNWGNDKGYHHDVSFTSIGQHHMHSPTVFNFYDPLYQPMGPVAEAGLVSPEAELGTGPYIVGFLNQMTSAIRGEWNYGRIRWSALNSSDAGAVVDELDELLTGGRLDAVSRGILIARYAERLTTSVTDALSSTLELFLFTAQFHATNFALLRNIPRLAVAETPSQGRGYKAIVYIYLRGGADTFNLLVPTGRCTGGRGIDLWSQYQSLRGSNAIDLARLLPITSAFQPCEDFGVHPSMTTLAAEYNSGDAAFVANVGPLVVPIDVNGYRSGKARPPMLRSHNTQTLTAMNVHAQASSSARGVLGRIQTALASQQPSGEPAYRMKGYSIAGNAKIMEGAVEAPEILSSSGPVRLTRYALVQADFAQLVASEASSVFAETFGQVLEKSVTSAEFIKRDMDSDEAALTVSFGRRLDGDHDGRDGGDEDGDAEGVDHHEHGHEHGHEHDERASHDDDSRGDARPRRGLAGETASTHLRSQLGVVANVIATRGLTSNEREVFFVQLDGWDTHSAYNLDLHWQAVELGLSSFVAEMKAQGVWENVTIAMGSEFGRTIEGNGAGTDHGWGGNSFVMGGSVNGGQIVGQYPDDLSDDSEIKTGRAMIPTTSWESMWHGIVSRDHAPDPSFVPARPSRDSHVFASGRAGQVVRRGGRRADRDRPAQPAQL